MQSRARLIGLVPAIVVVLALCACAASPSVGPDAGVRGGGSDGGDVVDGGNVVDGRGDAGTAFVWPSCTVEEDCASLGPGHMCMNGGCMLMVVDGPPVAQPPPRAVSTDGALLTDLDPDPAVFRASLRAQQVTTQLVSGGTTSMWLYVDEATGRASLPGPRIDVVEGTRVQIHFDNALPRPTTIHWHGLVLPNAMDGAPLPELTVQPGGSYDFDFVARRPSLYWFHPHLEGDEQLERGLMAAFVVRPADATTEPRVGVDVDRERVLVLDDILLDAHNAMEPPARGSVMLPDGRMTFEGMMGRQGNHLLVSGVENPVFDVQPGSVERWRVVVAANARFFRLALAGARIVQIGTDGGLLPAPIEREELLISPGERVDLLVQFPSSFAGDVPLLTRHHDRGHDMADPGDLVLATVRATGTPRVPARAVPRTTTTIETLVATDTPAQTLVMDESVLRGGKVGFTFNDQLWPEGVMLHAHLGDTETWSVQNKTHMDHPFHLHGWPFQVASIVDKNGAIVDDGSHRAWKDVVIVPPESTLRFVVRYDENPGMWMFHCHIQEHAERGMMGMIEVE